MYTLHDAYRWLREYLCPDWPPVDLLTDKGINRKIGELLNNFPAVPAIVEVDVLEAILASDRILWPANRNAAMRRRAKFPDTETVLQE